MEDIYKRPGNEESMAEFYEMEMLNSINVDFSVELKKRRVNDEDPAFGLASAVYLRKTFGHDGVKAVLSSPETRDLAFALCATLAGKNSNEAEAFHDISAAIHNFAAEHPEMVGQLNTDVISKKKNEQQKEQR